MSQRPNAHPQYRPDIDGLRGIAVLAVLVFHAFPSIVKGGFVGVDIFFVISGFLIGSIILGSLQDNAFNFFDFYTRRARRIFPSLIVVLCSAYALGWLILFPDEFKQLGMHIVAGAGFASNFALWGEAGYFDGSAELKPLLHLWSLGIEEQFYLAFPVLLQLAARKRLNLFTVCLLAAGLSFWLNVVVSGVDTPTAFYSPLTRIWELLSGSLLAYTSLHRERFVPMMAGVERILVRTLFESDAQTRIPYKNLAAACGLALVAVSVAMFDGRMRFPGWPAALPVLGACLLISAGPGAWINRAVLSHPMLVTVGIISYPLYLWHWPLLVFARIAETHTPAAETRWAILIASLVLAWLTWRLVEMPVRIGRHLKRFVGLSTAGLCAVAFVGFNTWRLDGLESRPVAKAFSSLTHTSARSSRASECFDIASAQSIENGWLCHLGATSQKPVAFMYGDSHALSMVPVFEQIAREKNIDILFAGFSGCPPLLGIDSLRGDQDKNNCRALNDRIFNHVKSTGIKDVILIARWAYYTDGQYDGSGMNFIRLAGENNISKDASRLAFAEGLRNTAARYREIGVSVHVLTDNPLQLRLPKDIYREAARATDMQRAIESLSVSRKQHESLNQFVNSTLDKMQDEKVMDVIDLEDVYCGQLCPMAVSGTSMYFDIDHLSIAGARRASAALTRKLGFLSAPATTLTPATLPRAAVSNISQ